ncbi:hypothetical protein EPI10_001275 [Gossypium australe]|uniref:Uncharacterized protein n=1 Tax=Gossypium australe TaxID=47621 RepID=A0A5B6VAX9_9ROSI|nr:hypothetical protein EPI10_001275 [Gossypium australe]
MNNLDKTPNNAYKLPYMEYCSQATRIADLLPDNVKPNAIGGIDYGSMVLFDFLSFDAFLFCGYYRILMASEQIFPMIGVMTPPP